MRICLIIVLFTFSLFAGCVKRTISISSNPSGALVWVNDREVGRTPVEFEFLYYGEYDLRLERDGYIKKINKIVIADENDKNSVGQKLAKKYAIERAPFFIVEDGKNGVAIYTVYFKFIKEIFGGKATENEIAKDIVDDNDYLDFI